MNAFNAINKGIPKTYSNPSIDDVAAIESDGIFWGSTSSSS